MGRFMYKIYHKEVPDIFDDLFMYNYHIHDYHTRVSSHLHVPLAGTNLSKTGICYQGIIVSNNILTADINPDCSQLFFKVMLKKCINQELIQIALALPAPVLFLFQNILALQLRGP